jgi:hypothetical protein
MNKIIFLIPLILFLTACTPQEPIAGGDVDEYGCKGSAGYQWCPSTEKCQRMWEEYCAEYPEQYKITNFQTCALAGNPVMESYPRQCRSGDIIYVEDLPGEPKKTYCTPDSRQADVCITLMDPVCGDDGNTYSNSCVACRNAEVEYWIQGEC